MCCKSSDETNTTTDIKTIKVTTTDKYIRNNITFYTTSNIWAQSRGIWKEKTTPTNEIPWMKCLSY